MRARDPRVPGVVHALQPTRAVKHTCRDVRAYRYDQDIPRSGGPGFAGLGSKWAPGGYVDATRGVWYRARVLKCDTATGQVQVRATKL